VRAEDVLEPIEVVSLVDPVHAAGAGTVAVEAERRDARDDPRVPEEVRAPRVAEAGAAGRMVVRQEQQKSPTIPPLI
jgi:hypothetical protein